MAAVCKCFVFTPLLAAAAGWCVWRILSLVYSSVFNNTQDIHGPAFDLYSYSPTLVSMLNILRFCCRKNSVETKGRNKNTKVKKKRVKNKDE